MKTLSIFAAALMSSCDTKPAPIPKPANFDSSARRVALAQTGAPSQVIENTIAYEQRRDAQDRKVLGTAQGVTSALDSGDQAKVQAAVAQLADNMHASFDASRALVAKLPADAAKQKLELLERTQTQTENNLSSAWRLSSQVSSDSAAKDKLSAIVGSGTANTLHSALSYSAPLLPTSQPSAVSTVHAAYDNGTFGIDAPEVLGGLGADALQDDTRLGEEIVVTPAVTSEAQILGNSPARIYDFVKNNITIDWAFGIRQDSEETLINRRGTPWEACALTIALLRAANVPARYVTGTIRLTLPQARDLARAASNTELFALLAQNGVSYVVDTDPQTNAQTVRVGHVFVEAFLDYIPSRGVTLGTGVSEWVAFDPALTGKIRNTVTAPAASAITQYNVDIGRFLTGYRSTIATTDVATAFSNSLLASAGSASALATASRSLATATEHLKYLANSFPYDVTATDGEYSFLPDSFKPAVTLSVTAGGAQIFQAVTPLHRLTGHRVTLTYDPATAADALLIDQAGGLQNAPLYLIQLTPELRIDGVALPLIPKSFNTEVIARVISQGGATPGTPVTVTASFGQRTFSNTHIAGMPMVIDFGAPASARNVGVSASDSDADNDLMLALGQITHAYLTAWSQAEKQLAPLFNLGVSYPEPSVTFGRVEAQVNAPGGVPMSMQGSAISLDSPLRSIALIGSAQDQIAFRRILAEQGSYLEGTTIASVIGVQATSATDILQRDAAAGTQVFTLTSASDSRLASLPPSIVSDITNQLSLGYQVVVPAAQITIQAFTGTGYIVTNLATGEASSILVGQVSLSGGSSVSPVTDWLAQLAALMKNAIAPASVNASTLTSPTGVVLTLLTSTNQYATVGQPYATPLLVQATWRGRPVADLPINFTLIAGDGALFATADGPPPVFTNQAPSSFAQNFPTDKRSTPTHTDVNGYAFVRFENAPRLVNTILDVGTKCHLPSGQADQRFGYAQILPSASVNGSAVVSSSTFNIATCPLAPSVLQAFPPSTLSASTQTVVLLPIEVAAQDPFQNAIANVPITWNSTDPGGRFALPNDQALLTRDISTTAQGELTDVDGQANTLYGVGDFATAIVYASYAGIVSSPTTVQGRSDTCSLTAFHQPRDPFFVGIADIGIFSHQAEFSFVGTLLSRADASSPWTKTTPQPMTYKCANCTSHLNDQGPAITPFYDVDQGVQNFVLTPTGSPNCDGQTRITGSPFSATPTMAVQRLLQDGTKVPLCQPGEALCPKRLVLTSDRALLVTVGNPADTYEFLGFDDPSLILAPDTPDNPFGLENTPAPYVLTPNTLDDPTDLSQKNYDTETFAIAFSATNVAADLTANFVMATEPQPIMQYPIAIGSININPVAPVPTDANGISTSAFTVTGNIQVPSDFAVSSKELVVVPVGQPSMSFPIVGDTLVSATVPAGTNLGLQPLFSLHVLLNGNSSTSVASADLSVVGGPEIRFAGIDQMDTQNRVFPDATAPEGDFNDIVTVRAHYYGPNPEATTLYWKALDVDDCSTDLVIDPNGLQGNDNLGLATRDYFGKSLPSTLGNSGTFVFGVEQPIPIQDSDGIASSNVASDGSTSIAFQVTHQPGDNFRIRISTDKGQLIDVPSTDIACPEPSPLPADDVTVGKTPIFTVWRHLNIEMDSMVRAAPSDFTNPVLPYPGENGATISLTGPGTASQSVLYAPGGLPTDFSGTSQFDFGTLRLADGSSYTIVTDAGYELSLIGDISPLLKTLSHFPKGMPAVIEDDDTGSDIAPYNISLPPVDLPLDLTNDLLSPTVIDGFSQAYIDVRVSTQASNTGGATVFLRNAYEDDMAEVSSSVRDENSSAAYWSSHLVAAFQGLSSADADGDGDAPPILRGHTGGLTSNSSPLPTGVCSGVLIYAEDLRENQAGLALAGDQASAGIVTAFTVAHELLHTFYLLHTDADPNTILTSLDESPAGTTDSLNSSLVALSSFGPSVIHLLRASVSPLPNPVTP